MIYSHCCPYDSSPSAFTYQSPLTLFSQNGRAPAFVSDLQPRSKIISYDSFCFHNLSHPYSRIASLRSQPLTKEASYHPQVYLGPTPLPYNTSRDATLACVSACLQLAHVFNKCCIRSLLFLASAFYYLF